MITYLYFVFVEKVTEKKFICIFLHEVEDRHLAAPASLKLALWRGQTEVMGKARNYSVNKRAFILLHHAFIGHLSTTNLLHCCILRQILSREHDEYLYRCLYSILSKCQFFVVSFGY